MRYKQLEQWSSAWGMWNIYINQNETQDLLDPGTSSDPYTNEDSSLNWGAGLSETSSFISLTGQNHINNWYNIYYYYLIELQMGFNPVAVVLQ
jgi:hypothetical protein